MTTYWVNPVSGSNSNSGLSQAQPKQTITGIKNIGLIAGDIIRMLPGIYSEFLEFNPGETSGGTIGNPITWLSNTPLMAQVPAIRFNNCEYMIVNGVRVTYDSSFNIPTSFASQTGVRIQGISGNNAIIQNCFIEDFVKFGFEVVGGQPTWTMKDTTIEDCQIGLVANGVNWLVQDVTIHRPFFHNGQTPFGDNDYCRFFGGPGKFLRCKYYGADVNRSESFGAHIDGFQTFVVNTGDQINNITIDSCHISDAHQGMLIQDKMSGPGVFPLDTITVKNCTISHIKGWAAGFEHVKNIRFDNNTLYHCPTHGVGFRFASVPLSFRNNIISDCKTSYWWEADVDRTNFTHGYNLMWNIIVNDRTTNNNNLITNPIFTNAIATNQYPFDGTVDITSELLMPDLDLSPAINSGITIAEIIKDQLGIIRPQGIGYDRGAFEVTGIFNPNPLPPPSPPPPPTPPPSLPPPVPDPLPPLIPSPLPPPIFPITDPPTTSKAGVTKFNQSKNDQKLNDGDIIKNKFKNRQGQSLPSPNRPSTIINVTISRKDTKNKTILNINNK